MAGWQEFTREFDIALSESVDVDVEPVEVPLTKKSTIAPMDLMLLARFITVNLEAGP